MNDMKIADDHFEEKKTKFYVTIGEICIKSEILFIALIKIEKLSCFDSYI